MAKYTPIDWKDEIKDTNGNLVQQGTPLSAINLKKMETGIASAVEQTEIVAAQLADTATEITRSHSIVTQGRKEKRAAVIFGSDDVAIQDYTILKPIVEEKKIPLGLAVITGLVGNAGIMSWSQIKEMESVGCEILCHSHNELALTEQSEQSMITNLEASIKALKQNGFNPKGFVYPQNKADTTTAKIVSRYFDYAFYGTSKGKNFPKIDNQFIDRVPFGSYFMPTSPDYPADTSSLAYYKARVDEAVANKSLLVFMLHPATTEFNATQQQHLRDIVDYIRSLNVEIVSPSRGFDIRGNLIQVGRGRKRFWVDSEGVEDSGYSGVRVTDVNAHKPSDAILSFEQYTITHTAINNSFAISEGFPATRSGILSTYNFGSDASHRYQTYRTTTGSIVEFIRYVNADYTWGTWSPMTSKAFDISQLNAYTANSLVTAFPSGQVLYTPVSNVFASDVANAFPSTRGGMLITTRLSADYWTAKQEYTTSAILDGTTSKERTWERFVDASNVWTAWRVKGELFFDKTTVPFNIPATSTYDLDITDLTSLAFQDMVTVVPFGVLPSGCIYTIYKTATGILTLRFMNITASVVSVPTTRWAITVRRRQV